MPDIWVRGGGYEKEEYRVNGEGGEVDNQFENVWIVFWKLALCLLYFIDGQRSLGLNLLPPSLSPLGFSWIDSPVFLEIN